MSWRRIGRPLPTLTRGGGKTPHPFSERARLHVEVIPLGYDTALTGVTDATCGVLASRGRTAGPVWGVETADG